MLNHHVQVQKSTIDRTNLIQKLFRGLSRVAPGVAARLAERVFLTPPRPRPPARELAWSAIAERHRVPSRFGPLPVWVWGEGSRTVLLVHGWAGRGLQLGAFAAPLIERDVRVVAFDGPGHGAAQGRTSSLPEMAGGVAAVARWCGRVDGVVAHSLGAAASVLAMARGDLEPKRIVVVAPPASFDTISGRFGELTGFTADVIERMRRRIEQRFSFVWHEVEPVHVARFMSAPLLVIHDRDDREIQWCEGRALAEAWPEARLVSTDGLGHRRPLRDPAVVHLAADFLTGEAAGGALSSLAVDPAA